MAILLLIFVVLFFAVILTKVIGRHTNSEMENLAGTGVLFILFLLFMSFLVN